MSKSERNKEEIGLLKVLVAICVALDASLGGWLAQNYATANTAIVTMGLVGVAALSAFVPYLIRRAYQLLQELEDA